MLRLAVLGIISMILTTIYFPWGWFQGKFGFAAIVAIIFSLQVVERRTHTVSTSEDSWITVPIVAYDYMRTTNLEDGTLMTTRINEDNGLLSIFVPEGYSGTFGITYHFAISWKIAYLISVLSCLGIVIVCIRKRYVALIKRDIIDDR